MLLIGKTCHSVIVNVLEMNVVSLTISRDVAQVCSMNTNILILSSVHVRWMRSKAIGNWPLPPSGHKGYVQANGKAEIQRRSFPFDWWLECECTNKCSLEDYLGF